MYRTLFPALAVFLATTAHGETPPMPLTYDIFEASVAHLDLESCPTGLPQQEVFCRAAFLNDTVHVFAFADDGDSPMVGYAAFDAPDFASTLQ